jgi:hypothetical protein
VKDLHGFPQCTTHSAIHPYHAHWVPFRSLSHPFTSVACSPPAAHNFACLAACHSCGPVMFFAVTHTSIPEAKKHARPLRLTVAACRPRERPGALHPALWQAHAVASGSFLPPAPSYRHACRPRPTAGQVCRQGPASFGRRRYYLCQCTGSFYATGTFRCRYDF